MTHSHPLSHSYICVTACNLHVHLREQSKLEHGRDHSDDDSYHAVEQVVEAVGDEPVRPLAEPILFHHDEVTLGLVPDQGRDKHLQARPTAMSC